MKNIYLINYANDWDIIENDNDTTKIKPKDFNPIKAEFIINNSLHIDREAKKEIMLISKAILDLNSACPKDIYEYILCLRVSNNTMVFNTSNIIITLINKEYPEILILDKNENLVLNISSINEYVDKKYSCLIYETIREIVNVF